MKADQLQEEIKEINLSYLLLAQQMIVEDRAAATFRLGIDNDMADLIASLTPAQLLKMAASNMLLCRFRFDTRLLQKMISNYTKGSQVFRQHAAILLSRQPTETVHV
jgi:flagellar transcriptional activator FlhD